MSSLTNIATAPTPGSVQAYALAEKADATRRAYRSAFELFADWCAARRRGEPLGALPETVTAFLARQASAEVKPSTLTRRSTRCRASGTRRCCGWASRAPSAGSSL